ncbi:MAG: LysM domain-containing protein, partial [Pseudomonadota bacterium]
LIYLLMIFFFFGQGCKKEESDFPVEKIRVRKPINRPSPPKTPPGAVQDGIKTDAGEKGTKKREMAIPLKDAPGESRGESGGGTPVFQGDFGYYTVRKGDTLSGISAKEEIYGDPLQWPILLRLNMDKLAVLKMDQHLPGITLPQGLQIRFLSPEAIRKKAKEAGQRAWAINILSSQHPEKITLLAISLLKKDYCAYITRARVKGKDWMRLRVGFFKAKADAMLEKETIDKVLDVKDSWIDRAGLEEMERHSGC